MLWVDTSFLYALFVERDQNHRRARRAWKKHLADRSKLVTSNLVIGELGSLFAYRFGHPVASKHIRMVLDSKVLHKVHSDIETEMGAMSWWDKFTDQRFSLVDCISFEFMQKLGVRQALSFDPDFRLVGFAMMP